jgi:hypothetical protein
MYPQNADSNLVKVSEQVVGEVVSHPITSELTRYTHLVSEQHHSSGMEKVNHFTLGRAIPRIEVSITQYHQTCSLLVR